MALTVIAMKNPASAMREGEQINKLGRGVKGQRECISNNIAK